MRIRALRSHAHIQNETTERARPFTLKNIKNIKILYFFHEWVSRLYFRGDKSWDTACILDFVSRVGL